MNTLLKTIEQELAVTRRGEMLQRLLNKETKAAVVGLGYVGLPLALEFAKEFSVIGFDINQNRVDMMNNHEDPSQELDSEEFDGRDITFTCDYNEMIEATFYVVAVPTPVDKDNKPNLRALKGATASVASVLKKGDYVVYESTVYPGCTEEVCLPILEELSGLKVNKDFKLGYSPERINPGDKVNTLTNIVKVVSGSDEDSLEQIAEVYGYYIEAGIHKAANIKVAEAAKIVENTQRDVNIGLMNELSVIFEKLDINTFEVLEAAGTKWNFLKFFPGLVGGHCIGVDPYYLIERAREKGVEPEIIAATRKVNDNMPLHLVDIIREEARRKRKRVSAMRVLVKGITFKEDVSDIRNSKVADLVYGLQGAQIQVDVMDPEATPLEVKEEYGIDLSDQPGDCYDVVVIAVNHKVFSFHDEAYYHSICDEDALIVDLKASMKGKINGFNYITL